MKTLNLAISILAALLLTLTALPAHAAEGAAYLPEPREAVLENGLKVLMLEDHKSPVAIFQIWYRVGAMDEPVGLGGMSHLLEHMMFKGTQKYASKVLSRTVQRNGGTDNAFTSKDFTAYFQILPSDRIGLSLDFESDRMRSLILDPAETSAERDVVREERRMRYEDDPQSALYEQLMAAAFNVHPYARPVIGWMSDLGNITPDDLAAHYRKFYSPNNAVIVVVGDIEPDKLLAEIKASFGNIPASPSVRRMLYEEPKQSGERRLYLKKEAELPYILAVYHTPRFPDTDAFALEVLAQVLSGGKSARLYKSLVYEAKLAIGSDASFDGFSRDPYLFFLDATAAPGIEPDKLEHALMDEIEKIKKTPPTEFELQKAKNQLEAQYIMQMDSIYMQAMTLGTTEITGGWRLRERYIEEIRKVTAAEISRVAAKYLIDDNRTIGILVPQKAASTAQPPVTAVTKGGAH